MKHSLLIAISLFLNAHAEAAILPMGTSISIELQQSTTDENIFGQALIATTPNGERIDLSECSLLLESLPVKTIGRTILHTSAMWCKDNANANRGTEVFPLGYVLGADQKLGAKKFSQKVKGTLVLTRDLELPETAIRLARK